MVQKYSPEHIEYIKANIKGRSYKDLTNMFNEKFNFQLKISTMISLASRHGLRNERDAKFNTGWEPTQFKKGHIPFNKGKKGCTGWSSTRFKKGHRPKNYRPVGSERVNADGYTEIKIADPKTWKPKHIVIWEAAGRTVPKGHVIIFADGNKQNLTLDNLLLVSRAQLAVINKHRLIFNNIESTKSGTIIADIYLKIGEQKKKAKK